VAVFHEPCGSAQDLPFRTFDIDFASVDGGSGEEVVETCGGDADGGRGGIVGDQASEDIGAAELDGASGVGGGNRVDAGVIERVDLKGVAESLEIQGMRFDARQLASRSRVDPGGCKQGVKTCVGSDIEEVVARPKINLEKMEHVPVEPLRPVHGVFGDDAIGISRVKTVAEDRLNDGGPSRVVMIRTPLNEKPSESPKQSPQPMAVVAGGTPDLMEDAEVGRDRRRRVKGGKVDELGVSCERWEG